MKIIIIRYGPITLAKNINLNPIVFYGHPAISTNQEKKAPNQDIWFGAKIIV